MHGVSINTRFKFVCTGILENCVESAHLHIKLGGRLVIRLNQQ